MVVVVTVEGGKVAIANLVLSGIPDRTAHIPLDGDRVCFEALRCSGTGQESSPPEP